MKIFIFFLIAVVSLILAVVFLSLDWILLAVITAGVHVISYAIMWLLSYSKTEWGHIPKRWWGAL